MELKFVYRYWVLPNSEIIPVFTNLKSGIYLKQVYFLEVTKNELDSLSLGSFSIVFGEGNYQLLMVKKQKFAWIGLLQKPFHPGEMNCCIDRLKR